MKNAWDSSCLFRECLTTFCAALKSREEEQFARVIASLHQPMSLRGLG